MTTYRAADRWLRTAFTRLERWAGIGDRQKYVVCTCLWLCYIIGSVPSSAIVAHIILYPRFLLCSPDIYLNIRGLLGRRTMTGAGAMAVDGNDQAFASLNAALRLPLAILTACLIVVAITGVIEVRAFDMVRWSVALLALSASMYLKDTDVRLLDREVRAARRGLLRRFDTVRAQAPLQRR
jgi:hypothetical protein